MIRITYLEQQIASAERLALVIIDALTAERLEAYADDCRRELVALRRSPERAERAL